MAIPSKLPSPIATSLYALKSRVEPEEVELQLQEKYRSPRVEAGQEESIDEVGENILFEQNPK